MSKLNHINQDIHQWLANNNIKPKNTRFSDVYETNTTKRVSTKYTGIHLSKDQARDLEFTLDELGHDIHQVTPSTKSSNIPYNCDYSGFRVIRNV